MQSVGSRFHPRRILVLHLGQLAEVVLSQPTISAIHDRFPSSTVTLVASTDGCQVGAMTGAVSDSLPLDVWPLTDLFKPWVAYRWLHCLRGIRQGGYELAIDLHSVGPSNALAWLSRAPWRLAARRRWKSLDALFTLRPPREDPRKHLVDRYADVIRPLGISLKNPRPQLRPPPEASARVAKWLAHKGHRTGQLLVGIYPPGRKVQRRWPTDRFAELAARLVHGFDVQLLLLGSPSNLDLIRHISRQHPANTLLLNESMIPTLAAYLAECTLLISDDAGITNLAAAINTPILGLGISFPLTPLGPDHVVIQRRNVASITVDEAFTAACRIIGRDRTSTLFRT